MGGWRREARKVYKPPPQKNPRSCRGLASWRRLCGARPMEIVASTELISVSNVFVLFHNLLWKAKLDRECLERESRCPHYLKFH